MALARCNDRYTLFAIAIALPLGDITHIWLGHKVGQRDSIQEVVNSLAQRVPEIVRQATLVSLAVLVPAAARSINVLVDRNHDLCHADFVRCQGECVATTWATHAVDEIRQLGAIVRR